MSKLLVIAVAALAVAAAAAAGPPRDQTLYGSVASVKPDGSGYLLRLDPALWLSGLTAERASAEDGFGGEVDNDYFIRDEGHKLLTYRLPKNARITVVVSGKGANPIASAKVSVAEFAQLIAGKNPQKRKLLGPAKSFGYWVTVRGDAATKLAAQYRP